MLLFAVLDAIQAPLWNAIYATGNIKTHQIMMATLKLLVLPLTWLALRLGDNGVWHGCSAAFLHCPSMWARLDNFREHNFANMCSITDCRLLFWPRECRTTTNTNND